MPKCIKKLFFASLFFFLLILGFNSVSLAQTNKTPGWHTGLYYGLLIPSTIPAIGESLPLYGVRLSKGVRGFRFEASFFNGSNTEEFGNEVEINQFALALKNTYHFSDIEDFNMVILTGLQYNSYESSVLGSFTGNGFHIGFGLEHKLVSGFWLRNDYLYSNGPGKYLMITLGLQYTFDTKKENSN